MPTQPIDPVSDSRITHKTSLLNGYTYHYLYAEPKSGSYTQTVFLVRSKLSYLWTLSRRIYCMCMNICPLAWLVENGWTVMVRMYTNHG
jgi:hypothetical protein